MKDNDTNTISAVHISDDPAQPGVTITAGDAISGFHRGSPVQDTATLKSHEAVIRDLLIGKNPQDRSLTGELLWETIYPGKARLFAEGKDPFTGIVTRNKPHGEPHELKEKNAKRWTAAGRIFMGFSTVDNALWDLRAKLLDKPLYKIMTGSFRSSIPVYWRPGEAKAGLADARKRAREAYEQGYTFQKWYFTKSAQDGEAGFKENVELVRVLREELPGAKLMFDNHSIRRFEDVDYSLRLCKAIAPYKPFFIEEPICPNHLDGYAKIKEEGGVPVAGGEHWYTRWQLKPFLERNCVDFVQPDPIWCGGISEFLAICDLVKKYPGVKIIPHTTGPWNLAHHCVAALPEELSPLLEFNFEEGRALIEKTMHLNEHGTMAMQMPGITGIGM